MCQGDSAQTVQSLEDLLQNQVFVGRVNKRACASPLRSFVNYFHHSTKTKLPCMNNPISRRMTRKFFRFSYTFNIQSNLFIKVQSPEAVTLRTFRWFLIQQVPLRVKPSTYILAQIRSFRNTLPDRLSANTKNYSAKQNLRLTLSLIHI